MRCTVVKAFCEVSEALGIVYANALTFIKQCRTTHKTIFHVPLDVTIKACNPMFDEVT
jgi:hypothetical protein